jgi:hypothetical protein
VDLKLGKGSGWLFELNYSMRWVGEKGIGSCLPFEVI